MATWHQTQARKRGGYRLDNPVTWTLLHDPVGGFSSSMTYETESDARAAYERATAVAGATGYVLLPPGPLTVYEPARGRNRAQYQAQIDMAETYYREKWLPTNPVHARRTFIFVRWYSKQSGYSVSLRYRDPFTGGATPVNSWFSR